MAKKDYSNELDAAIEKAESLLPGKTSPAPIMKYIASSESDYGRYDPETAMSYGPFQIDPIRYYDIAQNPERVNRERLDKVNQYMREELGNSEFDIGALALYNPETQGYDSVNKEMMRNPLVGAMLTRMALMQDPSDAPVGTENMSRYYMDFWGPRVDSDAHKEQKRLESIDKYNLYHPESATMDNNNLIDSAFTQ